MLTFGGYPIFKTSNKHKAHCPYCGEWYPGWLDVCPYCLGEGKECTDSSSSTQTGK
jgi:hypothetical protein